MDEDIMLAAFLILPIGFPNSNTSRFWEAAGSIDTVDEDLWIVNQAAQMNAGWSASSLFDITLFAIVLLFPDPKLVAV